MSHAGLLAAAADCIVSAANVYARFQAAWWAAVQRSPIASASTVISVCPTGGVVGSLGAVPDVVTTHRVQGRRELVGVVVVGDQGDQRLEQLVPLLGHVGGEHVPHPRMRGE